jgi:acid stress-induced BolA-like protein IbaG/YrbA
MDINEVCGLIETAIPGCRLSVDGEGCNFSVIVVSEAFEGLTAVKRQQRVLAALKEPLATGALHAISVKTYTEAEWEEARPSASGLVQIQ